MNTLLKAGAACGVAGLLALGAALPAAAQIVVRPYYGGPHVYVGPGYDAYAYSPGYGSYRGRYWDYPAGYDTGGMPYSRSELGWQGGWPSGAPANPCYPGQRAQNRC
jgi:hypothetical protein